jgi:hypothetical protein
MRVTPWLKIIENISLAIPRSFVEFHGPLARSLVRVNPIKCSLINEH